MVLTVDDLGYASYGEIVERLKIELQEDITGTITAFRLFAGTTTLSTRNYWTQRSDAAASPPDPSPPLSTSPALSLRDLLIALNHLSHFATQYLGVTVVVNNWRSTRPDAEWLIRFEIDRTAHIAFTEPIDAMTSLTEEQHHWVRTWVDAFIERCSKIIRNFPKTVRRKALDDRQKALLLFNP